jgi:methyl-accepting chemotaxis protein
MDEATQRNSALVEENAATSVVLERQAKAMDEQVAFFQVEGENVVSGEPKHVAKPHELTPRRPAGSAKQKWSSAAA